MALSDEGKKKYFESEKGRAPVHKTPEFQESIRRIKERDTAQTTAETAAKEEKPKQASFNIHIPGSNTMEQRRGGIPAAFYKEQRDAQREQARKDALYELADKLPQGVKISDLKDFDLQGYLDYQTNIRLQTRKTTPGTTAVARHTARLGNQAKIDQIEQIRSDVLKEFPQRPMGMLPDQYRQFIENKVQERTDRLLARPRYIFLSDGSPFFLDKADERAELEKSLIGESSIRRNWTLAKYDLASNITNTIRWVSDPSLRLKELLTDTDRGNAIGAMAQLGLNTAMLGTEYLRAGAYELFVTEERWKGLEKQAEAIKYTDPQKAALIMQDAQHWKSKWEQKQQLNDRLSVAKKAVYKSWEAVLAVREYNIKNDVPYLGTGSGIYRTLYFEKLKREEAAIQQQANVIRADAMSAYSKGDYENAISLIKQAQEKDREASTNDAYGAYTWIREPDRYDKFLDDAALLELQKGAPLSRDEINRLKEYHQNTWTEVSGELVYDPVNLIPGGIIADAVKIPIRGVVKVGAKITTEVPEIGKAIDVLGSPIRWLRRETVISGANRMSLSVHDKFQRIIKAYETTDDAVRAIDEVGNAVMEARSAPNEDAAKAIFERAQQQTPGLQQITFREFKQLVDAGDILSPEQGAWGKLFQDALVKAEDDLTNIATQTNKADPSEIVSDVSKSRRALMDISTKFHGAYVDPHRIFKGARLTDDTIAGWISKTARELSGDEISATLKTNGFDDFVTRIGETFNPRSRDFLKAATHGFEAVLGGLSILRDSWSTLVLSTPRWIMSNLPDTAMRSVVYGGNLWDDMVTLFTSTQRSLADELGVVPLAFSQALSRADLDFAENVTSRLLYEGWKPKAGLFSYWNYEYRRLFKGDAVAAKRAIMGDFLSGIRSEKLRSLMTWIGDGVYVKTPLFFNAWSGAISDFNTAVEFTFRLRMFHQEYFGLLSKLEPQFMKRGMDALSPATKELAEQIWRAAEGNPRRITAYVEALTGKVKKGTPAQWNLIVPPEIERVTKGMDAADRHLFISSVRFSLDEFIDASLKSGKELSGSDFTKFFDDYAAKFRDEIQARMSQSWDAHGLDNSIRTDGKPNEIPTINDLKGSAPVPPDEAARHKAIERATSNIKKQKRGKTENIAKDFETAISDYAGVERVPGGEVSLTIKDGKPTVQIGEELLKRGTEKLYDQLHEGVVQVLKNQDTDVVLRGGFDDLGQYETTLRKFMDDPVSVLNENERQFLTIANQLDAHPQLRNLLERTKDFRIKYDSVMDMYRDIGVYSDDYGFHKPPEEIFESQAQKIRAQPGYHIQAVQDNALVSNELARIEKTLPPELADRSAQMREYFHVYREELKQVYAFTYPGPLMKSTSDVDRHVGWELFYKMSAEEFHKEAALKQQLIDLLRTDPEAATKYMDDALNDFATYFLKQNGIEIEWDADLQKIMNIKITAGGRTRNFVNPLDRANLQRRFFTTEINKKLADNPLLKIRTDVKTKLHNQIRNNLRDVFQIPSNRASAWAVVIENHARKWSEVTGQPITKYYERLGFQAIEDGKGLATKEGFRLVKKGAVQRTPDGQFVFYGLGQSNFETMVRESGELFFDDLISMSEHSKEYADDLKALKDFLFEATGKPIRANKLDVEHSQVLSDVFASYIAHGDGPDIALKPAFEKFKGWITDIRNAIKGTPIEEEVSDDVYRVMDRMFIESKINDVPRTSKRTVKLIAKEAGVQFTDDDDLLRIINQTIAPQEVLGDLTERMTPQQLEQYDRLVNAASQTDQQLAAAKASIAEEAFGGDDQLVNALMMQRQSELEPLMQAAEEAQRALDEFEAQFPRPDLYTSLGDVPRDVALNALAKNKEIKIAKELDEAWSVWKTKRGLQGFPEDALASPDTFKQYLKDRMAKEWSEPAGYYNRLLWEVEQVENALLNYHAGDDFAEMAFPRVPETQMSDGVRTFIRNNEKMISNYEYALQSLDEWKKYMVNLADNGLPVLPKDDVTKLTNWSKVASNAKSEMIDTILNGGEIEGRKIDGAIDLVNHRMIDYQHSNYFDQLMKNFFPFWKFPSRSFPFWVETMATHPQIIAGYEKLQRMSRGQRYQAGAITSSGKPLPSLDGYIKIPGTDMWFNPLAPLSFRYVLDIASTKQDVLYAANTAEEDVEPKAWMVKELMQTGQIYGFSLAPWMAFLMKDAYKIPDEVLPRFPIAPQIPLIPRWMVYDLIQKTNKVTLPFLGIEVEGLGDAVYPEVPWHDYLVERRILENALAKIQSGNLSEAEKLKLVNAASSAIKYKGENDLWKSTYKEVTQEAWVNNMSSFFTGFHPKNFSDSQAALLALRNDRNQLKSALNNEFQATIFDIPTDADGAWKRYLDQFDTPDGWIYRLYTDIGWVRNEQGQMIRDPKERSKYLALKIDQDEDMQTYYDKMSNLYNEYNDRLRALPVGATWEQTKIIYDWFAEERASLQYLKTFEKYYGTNKPVELIQRDIQREWFISINSSKPRWEMDKGETYEQYQARVTEWQVNLVNLAPIMMRSFRRRTDLVQMLDKLHADQKIDESFFRDLIESTHAPGVEEWEKQNDDVFDALNKAWKATYWDNYWNRVIGKTGYEADLAEHDFYTSNPEAPNAQALYDWINQYYGDGRFKYKDIERWVEGTDTYDIEQRRLEGQDDKEDYQKRQQIWDMLSWLGPGGRNRKVFETAYLNAGGDLDALTVWYEESGEAYRTKPEKLDTMYGAIQDAIRTLDLKAPSRPELVRYIQAQDQNDTFKQLISDELGNQFFDYKDEQGGTQPGVFSYYNALDRAGKKKFKRENRDQYLAIQAYYRMRKTFGKDHPVWNDYFGLDTTPTVTLPETAGGGTMTPPALQGPVHRPGGGKEQQPVSSYDFTGQGSAPSFYIPSRIRANFSSGFLNIVGNKMAWEITNLYSSGRRISQAGITFLRGIATRYPQYKREVDSILAKT